MRRVQKELTRDTVEILGRMHGQIELEAGEGNSHVFMELLEQCRDAAARLGTLIEKIEGSGVAAVFLLEEYCGYLTHLYEAAGRGQPADSRDVGRELGQWYIKLKNSVRDSIKVRWEAVFLPYKASMWDSMESVWEAAEEDPDCDAYVIPVPYYDKNPDGTFREMHDESGLFPSYVPITAYGSFDFEKHHPDMIVIHNPYDECNYITSVHPFFFSKNLKRYTDNLIYIPYFILKEISPEDEDAVKKIGHFCQLPAVVHAHRVIVQSEDMRQVYINVLTSCAGYRTRGVWEQKILGIGSPKSDKARSVKKEDIKIPDEWMKVIRKQDGSLKKIILYNTCVTALLNYGDQMLIKIWDVLRIFKENSQEISLLWRPHPLIPAAITSMQPRLWEPYQNMVQEYQKEGWGIYDDTPELDRAIAISDAYYGDASSVVQLYQETGKPIMLQNAEMISEGIQESYGYCNLWRR